MPSPRSRLLALTLLAPLTLLAACGSSDDQPGASATVTETVSQSPSESASATPSASPTPSGTPTPQQTTCTTANLKASLGEADGAMGSTYTPIIITNTGTTPCTTGGFGGVSYVGGEAGVQIGAAAVRDKTTPVTKIVLAPGKSAVAQLQEGTAENYPAATCQPAKAQGLKIIPPDQTEPLFVKHRTTACRNMTVQLLHLQAYAAAG
ncbi:MAG: hypothetical protein JWO46_245 [Nocardioidaceae bacterium]|nr:hypothetical protein [Nocardioidaceae bacterium]